ncbi:unnamed protein product [Durusdinium trenchii]|uniref:Transmembrane protein n=1 Tax=Durusdinium trenchii TaxID=1381693 RepID=A0ABP0KMD4_9DINO
MEGETSETVPHRRKSHSEERETVLGPHEFEDEVHTSYFDPPPQTEEQLSNVSGDQLGQMDGMASEGREIFWCSLVESAAAAEVVLNLLLPCLVCSRKAGVWQPPSEWLLILLTLALNLCGTFLEGFFKATRLLSQSIRWSQKEHLFVFVTSEAFSAGALSVCTSFPGVSGSAGGVPLGLNSLSFGAAFSLLNMVFGLLVYLWGSRTGRLCFRQRWALIVRFAEIWKKVARATVIMAIFLPVLGISTTLPLDMAEPELRPTKLRLQYSWIALECPAVTLGLLCGIVMSVCGAALATYFCGKSLRHRREPDRPPKRFDCHERPAARLVVNVAASAMAYIARGIDAAVDSVEGRNPISATSDFLRSKFVSSFCGALSAFSGTLGDIADVQFGCASEDSTLDGPEKLRKGQAPSPQSSLRSLSRVPAVYNFLLHWILTLLVMWGCARFEAWPVPTELLTAAPVADGSAVAPVARRPWMRLAVGRGGSLEPDNEV